MAIKVVYQGPNGAVAIDEQQNTTVSSNYTVVPSDFIVTAIGAGAFTITLPPVEPSNGKNVVIKCLTTAAITINAYAGEFIDDVPSKTLVNGEVLDIVSDGTRWVDTIGTSIFGAKIIDGTITNSKLSSNAVTEAKIANNAVTASKIANNAVTADKIATGAVGADEINTDSQPTVNTIYTNNWFRSNGDTGWYNQTYGGGIHMTDSTWIRTYGNKNFYCGGEIRAGYRFSFSPDPGGGSGDQAQIYYYPVSGEACRLHMSITNDADDVLWLEAPRSYLWLAQTPVLLAYDSAVVIRGRTSAGGQESVRIPSPNNAFSTNWPAGWGGGLATWDIICASIQGNIVNTSDARLKDNVTKIDKGLDLILKLNPVSFYWTKEYNSSLKNQQFGFIAQDIEKVMPELVIPGSYDEVNQREGNRSLNYIGIIPFLTKAIQEQQEIIENQQKTIKSLEDRIKKIEDFLKL